MVVPPRGPLTALGDTSPSGLLNCGKGMIQSNVTSVSRTGACSSAPSSALRAILCAPPLGVRRILVWLSGTPAPSRLRVMSACRHTRARSLERRGASDPFLLDGTPRTRWGSPRRWGTRCDLHPPRSASTKSGPMVQAQSQHGCRSPSSRPMARPEPEPESEPELGPMVLVIESTPR